MRDTEKGMSNRQMAAVLFNIATILKREGNKNPYRTRAYERCGRALMGSKIEARRAADSGNKIAFARWQHIGKRLNAKIDEMAQSGGLDQYDEMVDELPAFYGELMRVPGIGIVMAERIHKSLHIETAQELYCAANDGRLQTVWGLGDRKIAAIRACFSPQLDLFENQ